MESLTAVETLSQREKNAILGVLQRDEKLRHQQDQKISDLKKEIIALHWSSVLKVGENSSKICLRCHVELGIIFNRGDLCPACRFKVCKQCQVIMFNGSWLCKLCYKQRQLKCMTGEWATTFEPNPLRKWASGSSLSSSSLEFTLGNTSIDIGETSSVEENKQGRKASKTMIGESDHGRNRVEVPKEADQLKLSELFNVLRVKKSEETKEPLTVFRKVISRQYSESNSESSSNSDLDVRSISTAPSMTESELDSSTVDSPKLTVLSLSHQTNNSASVNPQRILITNEKTGKLIDAHQPKTISEPAPAPRSPTLAVRSKVLRKPLNPETRWPVVTPRTHDKNQDSGLAMPMEIHSHYDNSLNKIEQIDDTSVPELGYHVENTQKSLKRRQEMEQSQSQSSLNSRNQINSVKIDADATFKHEATGNLDNKHIDNDKKESKTSDNHLDLSVSSRNICEQVSSHSRSDKKECILSETQITKHSNQNVIASKDIKEYECHSQNSINALKLAGSTCTFSKESIPSSNPSTTLLNRNISNTCQVQLEKYLKPSSHVPLSQPEVASVKISRGDHFEEKKTSNICFENMSKTVRHTVSRSPMENLTADAGAKLQQKESQCQQGLLEHNRDLVSNVDYIEGHLLEVSAELVKDEKTKSITANVSKIDDFNKRRAESECDVADECYIHAEKINRTWPMSELLHKLKTIDRIKNVSVNQADEAHFHKSVSGCVKELQTQDSDDGVFNVHDVDAVVQETYIKPEKKVRAESVIKLLCKKPESFQTKSNICDSSASQSAEDLSWFNENIEIRKDSKENKTLDDAMITKRKISKLNTNNTTTDNDRKLLETHSFKSMIDRKAKLKIKSDNAAKNSDADSGIGFNLNPVSPLPDRLCKGSNNDFNSHNDSHYVSDDNQDLDSKDDRMVWDVNENVGKTFDSFDVNSKTNYNQDVTVQEKMLHNDTVEKEKVTNISFKCRKRPLLKPLGSLDLLVLKQANFIDRNIEVELDEEYHTALESIGTSEKINAIAGEVSSMAQNMMEDMPNESQLEIKNSKLFLAKNMCVIAATNNSSVENMTHKSKQFSSQDSVFPQKGGNIYSKKNALKPKLQAKSSLDILLDKQYDNAENNEAYTELCADNRDKLKRDLDDCLPSQQKKAKTEYVSQDVPDGMSNVGETVTSHMKHISGDKADEFNQIFDDAKAYLDDWKDSNKVVTVTEPDKKLQSLLLKSCILQIDSDSDMLSVIDEREEESDETDDEDINVVSSNMYSKYYIKDVQKNEENQLLQNPIPVNKLKSVTHTKFLEVAALTTDKDEDMKSRTQALTNVHHGETCESAVTGINNNYFERKEVKKDMEMKYGMFLKENTRSKDKINDLIKKTDNIEKVQIDITNIMNSSSICMPDSNMVTEVEIEDKVDEKTVNNQNVAINYQNLSPEETIMVQDISNREMRETLLVNYAKEISWLINDDENCCINTTKGKVESGAVTNNITDNKICPNSNVCISDKYEEHDNSSNATETKIIKKNIINNLNMEFRGNLQETTDTEEDIQNDGNISYTHNCMVNRPINEVHVNKQMKVLTAKKPKIFKVDEIVNAKETEALPDILTNNTMNNTFNYIDGAINDNNKVRCHSIPNFGNLPEISVVVRNGTDDIQASNFNSSSLSDHNKSHVNDSDIKVNDKLLSIHANATVCKSLSAGNSTFIYNVIEHDDDCHRFDENYKFHKDLLKDRMCKDDDGICVSNQSKAQISEHSPVARLSIEHKFEDEKLQEQKSRAMHRAHLNLQVTADQQIILSENASNEAQSRKAPVGPLRSKNKMHTSTVPSSSEHSTPLSSEYNLDSPRIDIDALIREKMPINSPDSPELISECSSQDDSGHISCGSHDTMPDHKRADSNLSGSSLPSIQSTDDDEDIDKTVAMLQKQFRNRSYLLSVVGDSCESLTSVYSNAGGIASSYIPVSGEIQFSLNYNYKTNMLEVGIKQCQDIAIANPRKKRTDPYVKIYLLPDRTRSGKRKTKVKKHTTCPVFDETIKYSVTKSQLKNRILWVTVWHNDLFGHNIFLGEVNINFDYYKFKDPSPLWYILQCHESQSTSGMVYKGELSVSLRYVTAAPQPNESRKKNSNGQLEVVVKEAHNLTAVRSNGFSDPFCKGYLLPERHKSSKQKTPVIKKNCNPGWNHTFIFEDVTQLELQDRCLELTIWDHEKLASNDFLGGVRLNLGLGTSKGVPVDWMDGKGEEISIWQTMLSCPNIWIDGTINLRPNMDKIIL